MRMLLRCAFFIVVTGLRLKNADGHYRGCVMLHIYHFIPKRCSKVAFDHQRGVKPLEFRQLSYLRRALFLKEIVLRGQTLR